MKTKHILTAMVLPAMLAACTADEIVENNNVANVQGRALLNPMTITVNGAESRAAWSEQGYGKFVWDAENDKFSAFMLDVDGVEDDNDVMQFVGAPTKDQLLTNYLYASEDGMHYTTTSQMVEGAYWFYAPGREKNTRDLIPFKMETAQTLNYYKESADVQAFFTPIYNLTATDSPSSLDLSLTPYFGRAVVTVKNSTKEAFTLNQIVLESNTDDAFVYEGNISVKAVQSKSLVKSYIAGCDEWHYVGATITSTMTATEKAEAYAENDEAKEAAKLTANLVANDDAKKSTKMLVLDLTSEEGYLAVGETREYTLVVPATASAIDCKVTLIADKGVKTISSEIQSNYKYGVQFKHNGIMPMFGMNGTAFKPYTVKSFDAIGENVYYVTSYAQLMNLINTVNGTFTVYNIGDWGIDAAMAETIAKESDVHVIFKNAIYVTADAQSRTAEEDAIVLKKVTFLGGLTVKEDAEVELAAADYKENINGVLTTIHHAVSEGITVEEGATLKVSAGTINGGIEIAEDATVNLAAGTINGTIENEGTLNVAEAAVVANAINTYGTLNLTDKAPVVVVKEGNVTYKTAKTAGWASLKNEKLTLPALSATNKVNAEITIDSNVKMTLANDMTIGKVVDGTTTYAVKLVNKGEIDLGGKVLVINGELENAAEAVIAGDGTLKINGSAENNGTVQSQYVGVYENAALENNGTWYGVEDSRNEGIVTLGTNSKTRFDLGSAKGVINNNNLSKNLILTDGAKLNTVYYTFTSAVNSADVNALNCEDYSLNKVIFNETLTIDEDADYANADCNGIHGLRGINTIEFVKGLVIEAEVKNQVLAATITDIIINGTDVKFKGSNWLGAEGDKVCAIGTMCQTVTIKEGKKLTIVDMTLGHVGNTGKTTFVSEDDTTTTTVEGKLVNNGNVYTGKNGDEYKTATHAWWTGAAAQQGYFTDASDVIISM